MYKLAIIRNLIAGFVHQHLLHCSGASFCFIFVIIPCWAHAVKGLWEWGACQYPEGRVILDTCKDLQGVLPHALTAADPFAMSPCSKLGQSLLGKQMF